jgi:hypothetical protein
MEIGKKTLGASRNLFLRIALKEKISRGGAGCRNNLPSPDTSLLKCSSALNDIKQKYRHRDDQQNVNESPKRIGRDQTK